jgi:hypothetical protein
LRIQSAGQASPSGHGRDRRHGLGARCIGPPRTHGR